MDCPKCLRKGIISHMQVTHTYRAGNAGTAQRVECPSIDCGMVGSVVQVMVATDPEYGQGAGVLARKLLDGSVRVEIVKKQ